MMLQWWKAPQVYKKEQKKKYFLKMWVVKKKSAGVNTKANTLKRWNKTNPQFYEMHFMSL